MKKEVQGYSMEVGAEIEHLSAEVLALIETERRLNVALKALAYGPVSKLQAVRVLEEAWRMAYRARCTALRAEPNDTVWAVDAHTGHRGNGAL